MRPLSAPATLYTIAMSHYSEKIRWLLDAEQVDYREVALTPVFHMRPALLKGRRGRTTVPVLQIGDAAVQDSTRIIEWLDRDHGPLATLPAPLRQEALAIEDRFDAIGKDVARYLYFSGFAHTDVVLALWTRFATPLQTRLIRWTYPAIRAAFKAKLNINAPAARRAEARIERELCWLEDHLKDGRLHLAGHQLTVADITAAALLAPIACPPEHPVYGEAVFRERMAGATPTLREWSRRPGIEWVRQVYARHRGPVWVRQPSAA